MNIRSGRSFFLFLVFALALSLFPGQGRALGSCPALQACFNGDAARGCGCFNTQNEEWGSVSCAAGAERKTVFEPNSTRYHYECELPTTEQLNCPNSPPCPVGTENTGVCGNCQRFACANPAPGENQVAYRTSGTKILMQGGYAYTNCEYKRICDHNPEAVACVPVCPGQHEYVLMNGRTPSCMPVNSCNKLVFYGEASQYANYQLPMTKTVFCPQGSQYDLSTCKCSGGGAGGGSSSGVGSFECPAGQKPVFLGGSPRCVTELYINEKMREIDAIGQVRGISDQDYHDRSCELQSTLAGYNACKKRQEELGGARSEAPRKPTTPTTTNKTPPTIPVPAPTPKTPVPAPTPTPPSPTSSSSTSGGIPNCTSDQVIDCVQRRGVLDTACTCHAETDPTRCSAVQVRECELQHGRMGAHCNCVGATASQCTANQQNECQLRGRQIDPASCTCLAESGQCGSSETMQCQMQGGSMNEFCRCQYDQDARACETRTAACQRLGGNMDAICNRCSRSTACPGVDACTARGGVIISETCECRPRSGRRCQPIPCPQGQVQSMESCGCESPEGSTRQIPDGGCQSQPYACAEGYYWNPQQCMCSRWQ